MEMTVKGLADLVGISVRTLHYYDSINLLNPTSISESGYRLYSEGDLDKLQQILFFRELDFPLKKIKTMLDNPSFDQQAALKMHKKMLIEKRNGIDQMIQTIDQTLLHLKGELSMTNEEKFKGFDFNKTKYDKEAREKWGEKIVDKANNRINSWSVKEKNAKSEAMNQIFKKFSELRTQSPGSKEVQANVQKWYNYLNSNIDYNYTLEVFKSLGGMYVTDARFTKNIDQFGKGTAQLIKEAIDIYVENCQ
ncbi:MerR family transcriptional regulator [Staphylococcus nepalensis]|uniref:MerR family transcriptional regulator n=1 Tax=Staphylococcus nepalensis TaxID=214473 RepID=UPI0022703A20|nr:MerR family transcriptional regulator [Staphylococcus nepalensis]MCY1038589.1 MerR family transcriptional regulator [Staphylococcus nepalensis]